MTPFRLFLTLGLILVSGSRAVADEVTCKDSFEPAPGSYDFALEDKPDYHAKSETIGRIYYTRLEVFDESNPRENNALFRWANRFHTLTRERTVERDILFEEGDLYDPRVIDESARILRARDHLYDADIRPVSQCDDTVDVEVITRDLWSFTPELSYDRSGGADTWSFGIAETNLFGTGRELSFASKNDIDRTSQRFVYEDSNIAGKRIEGTVNITDSDDGLHQYARLRLPFYELDARKSWWLSFDKVKRDDSQYFKGNEVSSVRHEIEEAIGSYGFSDGLIDGVTRRWVLGYVYREDRFSPTIGLPPPASFPIDKKFSYPFVQFSSIEDAYSTVFNLDQIHRTEDLHLGRTFALTLGYASEAFGSDQDRLLVRGRFNDTIHTSDRDLLQYRTAWYGLWNFDTDRSEDVNVNGQIRYHHSQTSHRSFFATLDATWTQNLNTNQQVVLGGLTGTRAYDNRFQVGDRRIHFTMEQRQYTDVHILNLIRLGFAMFLDVGRAWDPDVPSVMDDEWLSNVGVGIRLASSKADLGRIIHIDFAFPLTNRNDPLVDTVQIAVNIKESL